MSPFPPSVNAHSIWPHGRGQSQVRVAVAADAPAWAPGPSRSKYPAAACTRDVCWGRNKNICWSGHSNSLPTAHPVVPAGFLLPSWLFSPHHLFAFGSCWFINLYKSSLTLVEPSHLLELWPCMEASPLLAARDGGAMGSLQQTVPPLLFFVLRSPAEHPLACQPLASLQAGSKVVQGTSLSHLPGRDKSVHRKLNPPSGVMAQH